MQEETHPTSGHRAVGVGLAIAIVLAVIVVPNGFPRYDLPQTVTAIAVSVGILGVVAVRRTAAFSSRWAIGALVIGALYALASAAIGGTAIGFDQASLVFLTAAGALAASAAGAAGRTALSRGVAVAAGCVAAIVIFGLVGVDLVADIPFTTPSFRAASGPFDDPGVLAAWSALALAVGAALAAEGQRSTWLTVVAAGLSLGAAGFGPLVGVVALASVAAFALGDRRVGKASAVGAACAAVALLATSPSWELADDLTPARFDTGVEWPLGENGAMGFFADATVDYAIAGQPFGHGAGDFAGEVGRYVDTEHSFAMRYFDGRPTTRRSPSPILELAGDFGLTVPLAFVLALVLAFGRWPGGTAVALVGAGVLAWSPGTLAGPVMLLLGVAIGYDGREDGPEWSVVPIAWVLAAVGVVALVHGGQTLRWGYQAASSITFFEHPSGSRDTALEYAAQASETQLRFQTEMNLATAIRMGGETDHGRVRRIFQRAVDVRPASVDARLMLADAYARESARTPDEGERFARVERMLGAASDLDPNHVEIGLLRANAAAATFDYDAATSILRALADREIPDAHQRRVLVRLAEICEDAERPEDALAAYQEALPLARDPVEIGRFRRLIEHLNQWIATGVRPAVQTLDPHAGHDHGSSSPGQAHDDHADDAGDTDSHGHDGHEAHDHETHRDDERDYEGGAHEEHDQE